MWQNLKVNEEGSTLWVGLYKEKYYTTLFSSFGTLHIIVYDIREDKDILYRRVFTRNIQTIMQMVENELANREITV